MLTDRPVGSRDNGSWMLVLIVLGLLAGALIVVLPSILGSRPATEAEPSRPAASGILPAANRQPVYLAVNAIAPGLAARPAGSLAGAGEAGR